MKKLMFAMAAMAAGAVFAEGEITSANVVGYQQKGDITKDKFYIFGSQFDSVGGGKNLNDVIGKLTGVAWDSKKAFQTTATQIQIPSAGGYTVYYYLSDAVVSKTERKEGWANGNGLYQSDVQLTDGVAFWFKNKVDEDGSVFGQQGQVPEDDGAGIRVECPTTFALRNNPYPVDFNLNGDNVDSSEVIGVAWDSKKAFQATATQIQVPSAGGYTVYYYLSDAVVSKTERKAGWANGNGLYQANITIPAGQGFWTKGVSGAFALTFKR